MRGFVLFLLIILVMSCGATYPSACGVETIDGNETWVCRCKTLTARVSAHPAKPKPAGEATWICDGSKLPLKVLADDTGLPPCQE